MNTKEKIKELCKATGTTAQKVEIACGLGAGFISKIDKSTPSAENIKKIADHLGVSVDYLMGNEDVNQTLMDLAIKSTQTKELLDLFDRICERDRRWILNIMREMAAEEEEYKKDSDQNSEVG